MTVHRRDVGTDFLLIAFVVAVVVIALYIGLTNPSVEELLPRIIHA